MIGMAVKFQNSGSVSLMEGMAPWFPVSEAGFLRSDTFVSLNSAINRHGLLVTNTKVARNQLFDAKNRSQSQTTTLKNRWEK